MLGNYLCTWSFIHSLTYLLTYSLTRSLIYSDLIIVLDKLAAEEEELENKIKQENSEILAKQAENIKKNAGKISKSGE